MKKIVKEKERTKENLETTYLYIFANTDKDCDLLKDRPTLSPGRTPTTNKTATVLTTAKIWP
jgi:hypothetical protein